MRCVRIATGTWAAGSEMKLIEPPAENWGIKSGVLASEADIGFKINV